MARYGTLGDYRFSDTNEAASDNRGAKVYGPKDHKLGEVDDVIFDESTGAIVYMVVDTGGWLTSRRFIVPPDAVRPSLQHENDFLVDLTKEQIENSAIRRASADLGRTVGRLREEIPIEVGGKPSDASRGDGPEHYANNAAAGRGRIGSGCR